MRSAITMIPPDNMCILLQALLWFHTYYLILTATLWGTNRTFPIDSWDDYLIRLNNLSQVIQLISGRVRTQKQVCGSPEPQFLPSTLYLKMPFPCWIRNTPSLISGDAAMSVQLNWSNLYAWMKKTAVHIIPWMCRYVELYLTAWVENPALPRKYLCDLKQVT